jgi:hypothetical protein
MENVQNAKEALISRFRSVIFNEKNKGRRMNKFFE